MAASKSKNTGHSGRNTKKKTAMEQEVGRFQTEIILFCDSGRMCDPDGKQFLEQVVL